MAERGPKGMKGEKIDLRLSVDRFKEGMKMTFKEYCQMLNGLIRFYDSYNPHNDG